MSPNTPKPPPDNMFCGIPDTPGKSIKNGDEPESPTLLVLYDTTNLMLLTVQCPHGCGCIEIVVDMLCTSNHQHFNEQPVNKLETTEQQPAEAQAENLQSSKKSVSPDNSQAEQPASSPTLQTIDLTELEHAAVPGDDYKLSRHKILNCSKRSPMKCQFDKGREFLGQKFKGFPAEKGIKWFNNENSEIKSCIEESIDVTPCNINKNNFMSA
ncbi:hypothetical protein B566_EDAN013037 [Ephemera danica]|nr:hypothetical protein B566_EDAN013037 [Ephemera danica]